MVKAPATRPAPFGAITTFRLVQAVYAVPRLLARLTRRIRAEEMVDALDERELADAGLSRRDRMRSRYSILAARSL